MPLLAERMDRYISVAKKKNHVTIIFKDDGIGIPDLEDTGKKGFGLTLIGLLTDQIGGSYTIEGNKGTRFIIEFDLV